jgi:hypothetical protein
MEKLILFYHTAADIPAPHCFSVKVNILVSNNASFQVAVEQIFTDRDEIPKEEIEVKPLIEERPQENKKKINK